MSLIAFAVRIATVRLLRAALPSAFVVMDSPVDAIDILTTNPSAGLVAVYTGQGENKLDGTAFFAGDPLLFINLQIFLPARLAFEVEGAGAAYLDTRAEGSQTALDLIGRMILRAIAVRGEPWGDLWGGFVMKVRDIIESSYLVETTKTKFVASEIRMICETLQEPTPGAAASGIWSDLLAAMQADTSPDSVQPLAALLAAEIALPAGLPQAEVDRIFLGISEYAATALNISSTVVAPENNPPLPLAEQADTATISVPDALSDPEVIGQ